MFLLLGMGGVLSCLPWGIVFVAGYSTGSVTHGHCSAGHHGNIRLCSQCLIMLLFGHRGTRVVTWRAAARTGAHKLMVHHMTVLVCIFEAWDANIIAIGPGVYCSTPQHFMLVGLITFTACHCRLCRKVLMRREPHRPHCGVMLMAFCLVQLLAMRQGNENTKWIEIPTSLRPISFFIDWRPMVVVNVCQVLFIRGSGILICGDSVEEAFHLALNVMSAIEIQVCCCMCLNHTSIVSKIWYSIIYTNWVWVQDCPRATSALCRQRRCLQLCWYVARRPLSLTDWISMLPVLVHNLPLCRTRHFCSSTDNCQHSFCLTNAGMSQAELAWVIK